MPGSSLVGFGRMRSKLSSSRARSRPGSTTAPFGSRAMAASRAAVAGIEPVEPAATMGAGGIRRARRSASAVRRRWRRSAASMTPFAVQIAGHCRVTISRKSREMSQ